MENLAAPDNKRRRDGPINDWLSGVPAPIVYHQLLYDGDNYGTLPNFIFHTDNLAYINTNASLIPLVKANPKPGESKTNIMNLEALALKLEINDDAKLTIHEYNDCIKNRIPFEESRDSKGPTGAHASWWRCHAAYGASRPNRVKEFEAWKKVEIEARTEFYTAAVKFNPMNYELKMNRAIMEEMMAAKAPSSYHSSPPSSSYVASARKDKPQGKQSFQASSGKKSSPSGCIYCGREDHRAFAHYSPGAPTSFPDGSRLYATIKGREGLTPDGKTICVRFNIGSTARGPAGACNHPSSNFVHVCSLCGSDKHFANSGDCPKKP